MSILTAHELEFLASLQTSWKRLYLIEVARLRTEDDNACRAPTLNQNRPPLGYLRFAPNWRVTYAWLRAVHRSWSCTEPKAMSVSSQSRAAEQNFDNHKRQSDGDDHYQHARCDHRLGVVDDRRRRDLNDIDPARDNGGWLDIYPAIHPWCLHRFFIRQHLRHRVSPSGLIDFLPNLMDLMVVTCRCRIMDLMVPTCGCRVPTVFRAMPIEMYRTEVLTRFGPAHAGR
jgi:hypothetical protein